MEVTTPEPITPYFVSEGYLRDIDEATEYVMRSDAECPTYGKISDLIVGSQPFKITHVEHLDKMARVTVTYQGDENDKFTPIMISPLQISGKNYLGKTSGSHITSESCVLFRTLSGANEKVDTVTKDIFVKLTTGGKPPFTSFEKLDEERRQFLIQKMPMFDKFMLVPRMMIRGFFS